MSNRSVETKTGFMYIFKTHCSIIQGIATRFRATRLLFPRFSVYRAHITHIINDTPEISKMIVKAQTLKIT